MQFAVYISDTSVTLIQSQGHQTYNNNIDPMYGYYNHAKFERSCFNSVHEKANVEFFFNKKICQLSPLNMCETQK